MIFTLTQETVCQIMANLQVSVVRFFFWRSLVHLHAGKTEAQMPIIPNTSRFSFGNSSYLPVITESVIPELEYLEYRAKGRRILYKKKRSDKVVESPVSLYDFYYKKFWCRALKYDLGYLLVTSDGKSFGFMSENDLRVLKTTDADCFILPAGSRKTGKH